MAEPIALTKETFASLVEESAVPVLVDFWASWCGPCRMVSPVIDELAEEYAGKITVGKVNVDEQGELASRYAIVSIPTILIFQDGKVVEKSVGVQSKDDFCDMIEKHL